MATKEDADGGASILEKGLGVLERAWEIQWALRVLFLALFVDIAMLLRVKHGLLQWSTKDMALLSDVGLVSILIVSFSVTVAILVPLVVLVLSQIVTLAWAHLPAFLRISDDNAYQRPLGEVPVRVFRDSALRQKDDFLQRLYEADQQKRHSERRQRERTGQVMAAILLAALADWFLARDIPGGIGLIGALIEMLGSWAPEAIGATLLYVGAALKWAWFPGVEPESIYYPPLDEELREEARKAREIG